MVRVIRPGSKVALPQAEIINATVRQVIIGETDQITYQVVWWCGGSRHEQWVSAYEVSAEVPELLPVGFLVPKKADQP
ncbi:MAG TPA: hypothetical protein VEI97_08175 [bacterium]|nr:hypothetical protein [bacterium]